MKSILGMVCFPFSIYKVLYMPLSLSVSLSVLLRNATCSNSCSGKQLVFGRAGRSFDVKTLQFGGIKLPPNGGSFFIVYYGEYYIIIYLGVRMLGARNDTQTQQLQITLTLGLIDELVLKARY